MVLSTPAFAAIKANWPDSYLTVFASPANAAVLKNNPHVDEVILYSDKKFFSQGTQCDPLIRHREFDLAVDPYDGYELKTAWLAWRSGAVVRCGYQYAGRDVFFNGPVLKPRSGIHFVNTALALLAQIGCPAIDRQPVIYLSETEKLEAERWLHEKGLGKRELIGIHPGGHYETQRWPLGHFAALIRLIRDNGDMDVVVFGSPSEKGDLDFISAAAGGFPHIFADGDIRRFFALLARCRLLVCNNSGPLHCATALGVPTISFMGPTERDRWYPLGDGHIVFRRDDLPCIGCGLGHCPIKTHDCLISIQPKAIWQVIADYLPNQHRITSRPSIARISLKKEGN